MPCGQLALWKICVPDAVLGSGAEFRQAEEFQRSEERVLLLKKILVSRQEHYSREGVRSYGRWMLYESGISVVVVAGTFGFGARADWMAFLPLSGVVLVLLRWGLAFGLGPASVTASGGRSSLADQLSVASVQFGPSAIPTSRLQGPECWVTRRGNRQYLSLLRVYLPSYG